MKLLFCNVGWMAQYDGIDGDSIARGGSYNQHSVGHEVCNFSNSRGFAYGYVQANGRLRLEKLGGAVDAPSVDNVTVVWTAGPVGGGTAVVGWYHNATVYRDVVNIATPTPKQLQNGVTMYRVKARFSDAYLLPAEKREVMIPRGVKGGIGQSNVWYADAPESQPVVRRVRALISRGAAPLMDIDDLVTGLEGRPRLYAHLRRERDAKLVRAKKAAVLKAKGSLSCEICGFDFASTYGEYGDGMCEVHHLTQLAKADGVVKTSLNALAIVCSNCHRVIHRHVPMLSPSALSDALSGTGQPSVHRAKLGTLAKNGRRTRGL